jgi:hypothetical protein
MILRDCVMLRTPAEGEPPIPRGCSGNSVANHTWITRSRVRARKVLIIGVVELRSCGFDSHHPLQSLARLRSHQPSPARVPSEGRAVVAGPDAGRCWRGNRTRERTPTAPTGPTSPWKRTFATGYYRPTVLQSVLRLRSSLDDAGALMSHRIAVGSHNRHTMRRARATQSKSHAMIGQRIT